MTIFGVFLRIWIVSIFLLCTASTASFAEQTEFTIAVDPQYAPFSFRDDDGKAAGFLVDFWNAWAHYNGYKVHYRFYAWEQTLQATKNGEVDFHSGTTKDRDWMYASDKIYRLYTGLFTRTDMPYEKAEQLAGKTVGTIDRYYGELAAKTIGHGIKIRTYDDYGPIIAGLLDGEIDAFIEDRDAINYYLISTGRLSKIRMIHDPQLIFYNDIFAIVNRNHRNLLPQINRGIKNIPKSELERIEKAWMLNDETLFYSDSQKTQSQDASHFTLYSVSAFLLFIFALLLYYLLRRQRQIRNAHENARKMALTDALTGLPNRRAFDERFNHEDCNGQQIAFLFVDVDYFKAYNDTYGHKAGDKALQSIGNVLLSFASKTCWPYRIGGEEFCILLRTHHPEEAAKIAGEISKSIEALKIAHEKSPFGFLTVSIGISIIEPHCDKEMLYNQADKALYEAKAQGRNRVVIYNPKNKSAT